MFSGSCHVSVSPLKSSPVKLESSPCRKKKYDRTPPSTKSKRVPWTTVENDLLKSYFSSYIRTGRSVPYTEARICRSKNKKILGHRRSEQIVSRIKNIVKARERKLFT
uniref:Uncharacterized protein n=1 Tax=Cacopsylla melanoneura TaxID=428564 RepID=A0A8D9E7D5_9HEMI